MCCGNKNTAGNLQVAATWTPKDLIKGAVGLSKIALRQDLISTDAIKARRDACRNCEFSTKNKERLNTPTKGLTNKSMCIKCKCFIIAKTQLVTEKCPLDLW